jgi:peptide/nickel transport system substrate-binding protein
MKMLRFIALVCLLSAALSPAVLARDLIIGVSNQPHSIDPQFSRTGNNGQAAQNIFERLVQPDENLQLQPALAVSWENTDPLTWVVKLRAGVRFHDASPLTAEDVVFSLERAGRIPDSPAPFTANVAPIASMEILDPLTIKFTTKKPAPQFMEAVGMVFIVSKAAAVGKGVDDFNSGKAAVGTGPYKFVAWTPGDRLVLERNEKYWDKAPDFDKVTYRLIANNTARVAALRAGDVDLIDEVRPADKATLAAISGIRLHSIASTRLIYLNLDCGRDESPFVVGAAGKPLKPNPLRDARVRQAISKMIDRKLIIDRILSGAGMPAGQLVPHGLGGYSDKLPPERIDLKAAKELLAQAGYPNGFGITIHSSRDRFPGDAEIAQAVGQLLARGGLKVKGVVTQPYNVYVTAASKQAFSAFIFSYGTNTPSSAPGLTNLLMTYDQTADTGSLNRARYSNPSFDTKMRQALVEFDERKRSALLAEAADIAFGEAAFLPLYWQEVTWASRTGVEYRANRSEATIARYARIVK